MKLTQLQVSEKNRYQNCLTWSNTSDCKCRFRTHQEEKPNIEQLVHKRMKDKVQDLKIAIEGNVTPE